MVKNLIRYKLRLLTALFICFLFSVTAYAESKQVLDTLQLPNTKTATIRLMFNYEIEDAALLTQKHDRDIRLSINFNKTEFSESDIIIKQKLYPPALFSIPFEYAKILKNKGNQATLVLHFTEAVKVNVLPQKKKRSIEVILPEIQYAASKKIEKLEKIISQARSAITVNNNNKAIKTLTYLLSQPPHRYSQEGLEMLAIARERNGQLAHAKKLYQQYLLSYKKGEGATRVKQRLAHMINQQLKPKPKLKSTRTERKNRRTKKYFGSWSQYLSYDHFSSSGDAAPQDQSFLVSHFNFNTRSTKGDYEIRGFVDAGHVYRFDTGDSDGIELSYLYGKVLNDKSKTQFSFGRQRSQSGGVFSRFDGVSYVKQLSTKYKLGGLLGFPVDLSDKNSVQTKTPFIGTNIEILGLVKGLEIKPYFVIHQNQGLRDRTAIGNESQFSNNKGYAVNIIDYDIYFSQLNMFLLRGQYQAKKNTSIFMNLDYRKSPLLRTGNSLLSETRADNIKDLKKVSDISLRTLALNKTGWSSYVTLGMRYTLNPKMELSADFSRLDQTIKTSPEPTSPVITNKDWQNILSLQLILRNRWLTNDSILLSTYLAHNKHNNSFSWQAAHRFRYLKKWNISSRFRVDKRSRAKNLSYTNYRPSLKVNYSINKAIWTQLELGSEWRIYGSASQANDYNRIFTNFIYRWLF